MVVVTTVKKYEAFFDRLHCKYQLNGPEGSLYCSVFWSCRVRYGNRNNENLRVHFTDIESTVGRIFIFF